MPVVLERPLVVKHRSNWCSGGSCCVLIHWGAAIVLPFVIAFAAGGLWTKEVAAREQPLVRFRHEALVEMYRLEPSPVTGEQPVPVKMGWSTSGPLNDALGAAMRPCELRSWEEDDDRDGKADSLRFHLKVPLDEAAGERLHSLTFMVGVSALFSEETTLALNGTATVAHSSALPGARWRQSGELQVRRSDGPFRATVLPELSPCSTPFWMLQDPVQARRRRRHPARRTARARAPRTKPATPARADAPPPALAGEWRPHDRRRDRRRRARVVQYDGGVQRGRSAVDPGRRLELRARLHGARAVARAGGAAGDGGGAQARVGAVHHDPPPHLLGPRMRPPRRRRRRCRPHPGPPPSEAPRLLMKSEAAGPNTDRSAC